jgi:hypothetical protein
MCRPMMNTEGVLWMAQRALVLQLLRDDHVERWARAELERGADDLDALTISDALALLEADGVVVLDGESVSASRCARRLDALGLVGI